MLTERQSFKVAFLKRCADAGLTIEETHGCVKEALDNMKQADGLFGAINSLTAKPLNTAWDVVGDTAKTLGNIGITGLVLGPPAAGAGAGYLASRLGDVDEDDIEAAKKKELIEAYRMNAEKLRRKQQATL